MEKDTLKDLEQVKLSDYFTDTKFRTVRDLAMLEDGGVSEIKVIVEIRDKFAKSLTFNFSNTMSIYCFAIMNDKLKEINKDRHSMRYGNGIIKRVVLSDCGKKFTMTIELKGEPNLTYLVGADEVRDLLNECLHGKM